eukprot:246334-Hanusia_phi.AAC.1
MAEESDFSTSKFLSSESDLKTTLQQTLVSCVSPSRALPHILTGNFRKFLDRTGWFSQLGTS